MTGSRNGVPDYSEEGGAQKALLGLPLEEQDWLEGKRWEEAIRMEKARKVAEILNGRRGIEIAGKIIYDMPLESVGLTLEQQKRFLKEGGFINPTEDSPAFLTSNQQRMILCRKSFEDYGGFDVFLRIYRGFPEISKMLEAEARDVGLYPYFYYRNYFAIEWMAKEFGGKVIWSNDLYSFDNHESSIWSQRKGNSWIEKLASIGQAPFGLLDPITSKIRDFGTMAFICTPEITYPGWQLGGWSECYEIKALSIVDKNPPWYNDHQIANCMGAIIQLGSVGK